MIRFVCPLVCFMLLTSSGCSGLGLPFTDFRLGRWEIESSRIERNSGCTNLESLAAFAEALENQHLLYIRTKSNTDALVAADIFGHLSQECQGRMRKLSIPEIKTELFGDVQILSDATKLTGLGGIAFDYTDVRTKSGIEPTLHLNSHQKGPRRRLVAIYRLEDDRVIHFNYSGIDNVDKKKRIWPIREFLVLTLGLGMEVGAKAITP